MIKYILDVKNWQDREGNTYYAGRVYDLNRDVVLFLPFAYGYGSAPEYAARQALNCEAEDIMAFYTSSTKASCQSWGHEIKGPYKVYKNGGRKAAICADMEGVKYIMAGLLKGETAKVRDTAGFIFWEKNGSL